MEPIYLDYNATTPLLPEVIDGMLPFLREHFGNPSSLHAFGQRARRALDEARDDVARFVGATPEEIVFTAGGTESNNLAIKGTALHRGPSGHVVTSALEHPAVLNCCTYLERRGWSVSFLPADANGKVDDRRLRDRLQPDTALVSIMLANNETGVLQPVREITRVAHEHGALVHTDAVQAAGRIPVDFAELDVDLMSLSAHKLCGPKGVGALVVRRGVALEPLFHGGNQERRRRPGTENLASIAGFGVACRVAGESVREESVRLAGLRDRLEESIVGSLDGVRVNGAGAPRLPNTSCLGFHGVSGDVLAMNLDMLGVAVSTGSACSSGAVEPSHVLLAMGLPPEEARSAVRFSLGRFTTEEHINRAAKAVVECVRRLRAAGPPPA